MAELTPDTLTDAYMARVAAIRERVVTYSRTLWGMTTSLRDSDVDRLVERLVPVVQGGQMQMGSLTSGYIRQLAVLEGLVPPDVPVDREVIVDYRGVPAEDVYRRPAVATYSALSTGATYAEARDSGLNRLLGLVMTDLQQSRNRQARQSYSGSGFDYTVRTLSGTENCALCVIASTQRYNVSGLMPIHPGCDCGERGVTAGRDPGQVIDSTLLEATHSQIEAKVGVTERRARDLGSGKYDATGFSEFTDLIIAREHGELGPTLTWRKDRWTGPGDLN